MPVQIERVSVMPLGVQIWVKRHPTCTKIYVLDAFASELGDSALDRLRAVVAAAG